MKSLFITLLSLNLLNIDPCNRNCLASSLYNKEVNIKAEKAKIQTVLEKLDRALQTENMEKFSEVFIHDQDIIIIGPDLREKAVGWEALAQMQNQQFRDLENTDISIIDQKINIDSPGDIARYLRIMDIEFVTNDLYFYLKGVRETGVLKKRMEIGSSCSNMSLHLCVIKSGLFIFQRINKNQQPMT